MYTLRQKAVWFALVSRIFILLLQTVFNAIIPDHEAKGVFKRPKSPSSEASIIDGLVDVLVGGLERWDAQYFLHIAENGYVYENSLAFFPGFPIALRFVSGCLNIVSCHHLGTKSLLLLASVFLNTFCFVKAADILFDLSVTVLKDDGLAYKAVLLFCVNPASIFFSAPYSEAVFALLSFYGMRHTLNNQFLKFSAIPFGLAAATRSNGILNVGFIVYSSVKDFILVKWPLLVRQKGMMRRLLLPFKVFLSFFPMVGSCTIALAPFFAYQVYCYLLFCTSQQINISKHLIQYGESHGFIMPGINGHVQRAASHWCNMKLPIAYSYVQDHYWNVGFLRYYEWKQMPNFVLAAPMIMLILSQTFSYVKEHRSLCFHLGYMPKGIKGNHKHCYVMSPEMFVYVVHICFLTLFCILFVHIQVTTRMICSSSPVPYWYAAYLINYESKANHLGGASGGVKLMFCQMKKLNSSKLINSDDKINKSPLESESLDNMHSKWRVIILTKLPERGIGQAVLIYFLLYCLVGTVLFCNFLPWT